MKLQGRIIVRLYLLYFFSPLQYFIEILLFFMRGASPKIIVYIYIKIRMQQLHKMTDKNKIICNNTR